MENSIEYGLYRKKTRHKDFIYYDDYVQIIEFQYRNVLINNVNPYPTRIQLEKCR